LNDDSTWAGTRDPRACAVAEVRAHLGLVGARANHTVAELVALAELEAQALLGVPEVAQLRPSPERARQVAQHVALALVARLAPEREVLEDVAPVILARVDDRLTAARVPLAFEADHLVDHAQVARVVQEATSVVDSR